jgi:hypothetical protein
MSADALNVIVPDSSSANLSNNTDWLVDFMQNLGYKSDKLGVCGGFAYAAKAIVLASKPDIKDGKLPSLEHFIDLFKNIYDIHNSAEKQAYEWVDQQARSMAQTDLNEIEDDELDEAERLVIYQERHQQELMETAFAEQTKKLILEQVNLLKTQAITNKTGNYAEICALCVAIELYHQPHLYGEFVNHPVSFQDNEPFSSFLSPVALDSREEIFVNKEKPCSRTYDEMELSNALNKLQSQLDSLQRHEKNLQPVSLILKCSDHVCHVGYDPRNGAWSIFDTWFMPGNYFFAGKDKAERKTDTDYLAHQIISSFSPNRDSSVFFIEARTSKALDQTDSSCKLLQDWLDNELKMGLQQIEKVADRVDDNQADWLFVAAQHGQVDIVKKLLAAGYNPNALCKQNASPLYIAAQNGHQEVVKLLIYHGANLNQVTTGGMSPSLG